MNEPLKVGTDFSGIGAPEEALKELGIPHIVEFACDKDKYARQSYLQTHETKIMYEDVTTRDNDSAPVVDLYCFGFPCQAFSLSGKRLGFDDVRGTLFFNSADYIKKKRPKVFIAENVKGLLSHDKPRGSKAKFGRTFNTIINLLAKTVNGQILIPMYEDNLGYNIFYKILNSKHYDVPQNRDRIFIVGFRDDVSFSFPNSNIVTKKLADILEKPVHEKYYLSDKMLKYFKERKKNFNGGNVNFKTSEDIATTVLANVYKVNISDNIIVEGEVTPNSQAGKVHNHNGLFPTLTAGSHGYALGYITEPVIAAMVGRNPENVNDRTSGKPTQQILEINSTGLANTITTVQKDNLVIEPIIEGVEKKNVRIRRLTPLECFRLQGYSDEFFHKIKNMSDTQLYKQAGNSITVKVFKAILKNIYQLK